MTTILDFSEIKARDFLLKEDSYSNVDLPEYITFQKILDDTYDYLKNHKLSDCYNNKDRPDKYDEVNYKIIANKDGLYAWRPFQLIHPALYVELVKQITEKDNWKLICDRFKEFQENEKIQCASIPIVSTNPKKTQKSEQITTWWKDTEQASIKQALEFSYIYITDITDCYGSIYTHTICWALHGKEFAKRPENRNNPKLIGCLIDLKLRDMAFGQTNGIPQGSVLMDFIAEIVLGYADLLLSEKLKEEKIENYHIIRYRDDYRIFVNNPTEGDAITKYLTEILIELGLKLNPTKTSSSKNVILESIKKDKLDLITSLLGERCFSTEARNTKYNSQRLLSRIYNLADKYISSRTLKRIIIKFGNRYFNNKEKNTNYNNQRMLLQIYDFANKHPNSGQLKRILTKFYEKMEVDSKKDDVGVLLSIVVNLAYNNPSTYNFCAAIISKIIECVQNDEEKINYIKKIIKKFKSLPNTGFMDIWLQRISYKISSDVQYEDKLCKLVNHQETLLWNSDWLTGKLKQIADKCKIINENIIEQMSPVITQKEVDAFQPQYDAFDWGDDVTDD
jgi:hypothetical protein